MSAPEHWYKAIHEAGHVVVAFEFGHVIEECTIEAAGDEYDARTLHRANPDDPRDEDEDLEYQIELLTIVQAGTEAETMAVGYNQAGYGLVHDVETGVFFTESGTDAERLLDLAIKVTVELEEQAALLEWVKLRTRNLVRRRWALIESVASALVDKGTLHQDDIASLINDGWLASSTATLIDRSGDAEAQDRMP